MAAKKETMKHLPMGQMPVLEIDDGKVYHQSKAISRFVAKKGNLYGSDDVEAMEIDATVETINDLATEHTRITKYEKVNVRELAKAKYQECFESRRIIKARSL